MIMLQRHQTCSLHPLHDILFPAYSPSFSSSLRCRIRVHLPLPTSHGNIHEAAGVLDALLRAALGGLFLLLGLDLHNHQQLATI
jgi:hypothetical protein